MRYEVERTWMVRDTVFVDAVGVDHAAMTARTLPLPEHAEYVSDSLAIDESNDVVLFPYAPVLQEEEALV